MCSLLCCLPMKLEQLNKKEVHTGIRLIKYVTFTAVISLFRSLVMLVKFLISTLYVSPSLALGGKFTHSSRFYSPLSSSHLCSAPLFFFFLFPHFRHIYLKFLYHLQMPYVAERPEVSWAYIFTKNAPIVNR